MKKSALDNTIKEAIAKLVGPDFMEDVFNKQLPLYYSDFKALKSLELNPHKRHLGVTSAVFVVEYKITYLTKEGASKNLSIFASAHSDGSRRGAFIKTKFLYEHGFAEGQYRVTKPLFFLEKQRAFFYKASPGSSFFYFFTKDPTADLKQILTLVAGWAKQLHGAGLTRDGFSWPTFSIADMIPTPVDWLEDFLNRDKKQGGLVAEIFKTMIKLEKNYHPEFSPAVIYGDYHPENIIINSLQTRELEMIDFVDLALGDPMLDLGSFLQQFDFMGHSFLPRQQINKDKEYFLEAYFGLPFNEISEDNLKRINLYQAWTALRTAIFLFYTKDEHNPMEGLLLESQRYLELSLSKAKQINLN
jgi:hypothetical protein